MRTTAITTIALFLALFFLPASTATAAQPAVRDDGGFFSETALVDANRVIAEIKRDHNLDVVIQTFPAIPQDRQQAFDNAGDKNVFYDAWLSDNARAQGVRGIYILIVKSPGHLQVGVGQATRVKAFTFADRDRLRDVMLADFKNKQFDQGLQAGVSFAKQQIDQNLGATTQPTTQQTDMPVEFAPEVPPSTQPANSR